MQKKTKELISRLLPKWEDARSLQNRDFAKIEYGTNFSTVNGDFSWNSPYLVMLCDFVGGEGYEESGTILGLSRDGKVKWEYQSHCSCDGFSDGGEGEELKHEHILEKKTYRLNSIPVDWEEQIQDSITKLLSVL